MKKNIAIVLVLVMVVALCFAGCSNGEVKGSADPSAQVSGEPDAGSLAELYASMATDAVYLANDDLPDVTASKDYTIGVAMTTVSTDWFKSLADEVKAQVEAAGCTALVSVCEDDVTTQISQLENFIAQKVDGIILGPCNPQDALTPVLKELAEAGIPVVTVNDMVAADAPVFCAVSVDAYALGKGVGSYLAAQLLEKYPDAEKIEYALIGGKDGDTIAHNRNEGAKAGIAEVDTEGKIELVSFLYSGGYSEENGLETAQNMLTAHPDIKCIVGTCDSHVIGASQAMTVLGLDSSSVIMGAVDGSAAAMESIANNGSIVCTGMNDTHAFGVLSAKILVAYLNDGTLPQSNNIVQDPVVCTIDNIGDYYTN